jgi:hypothetical protein
MSIPNIHLFGVPPKLGSTSGIARLCFENCPPIHVGDRELCDVAADDGYVGGAFVRQFSHRNVLVRLGGSYHPADGIVGLAVILYRCFIGGFAVLLGRLAHATFSGLTMRDQSVKMLQEALATLKTTMNLLSGLKPSSKIFLLLHRSSESGSEVSDFKRSAICAIAGLALHVS